MEDYFELSPSEQQRRTLETIEQLEQQFKEMQSDFGKVKDTMPPHEQEYWQAELTSVQEGIQTLKQHHDFTQQITQAAQEMLERVTPNTVEALRYLEQYLQERQSEYKKYAPMSDEAHQRYWQHEIANIQSDIQTLREYHSSILEKTIEPSPEEQLPVLKTMTIDPLPSLHPSTGDIEYEYRQEAARQQAQQQESTYKFDM